MAQTRRAEDEELSRVVKRAKVEQSMNASAEDEDEDEEMEPPSNAQQGASDLYLDTVGYVDLIIVVLLTFSQINRAALDFDFEKVCSVSLSNINVYGCLVCGKYFQGRGRRSYAYSHSIHDDHHVFINLETCKVRHH